MNTARKRDMANTCRKLIAEEVRKQEDVLANALQAIFSFKRQWNTFSPVSALPPEMLCRIFHFATIADRDDQGYSRSDSNGVPTWIPQLTHVCHHWRSVALTAPELWTELPLDHKRWTQVMLERSRMANITINRRPATRYHGLATSMPVLFAMFHQKRIGELSLKDLSIVEYEFFRHYWPNSVPNLRSLTISVIRVSDDSPWDTECVVECLPAASFADCAQLRSVHLKNIAVDWTIPIFQSNLTKLIVCGPMDRANLFATIGDLHSALHNTPYLVALELEGLLPSVADQPPTLTTIPLKKLRALTVGGSGGSVAAILQMIAYPLLDCLDIHFLGDTDHNLTRLLKNIKSDSSLDPSRFPKDIVYLNIRNYKHFEPLIIAGYSPSEGRGRELAFDLKFTFNETAEGDFLDHSFAAILSTLPIRNVTSICVGMIDFDGFQNWADHFAVGFPWLKTIEVSGNGSLTQIVQALSRDNVLELPTRTGSAPSDRTPTSMPSFPKLQKLIIRGVNFQYFDVNLLVNAVVHRSEVGLQVSKLKIYNCDHIRAADVDRLQGVVAVDWDRYEGFTDEEGLGEDDNNE